LNFGAKIIIILGTTKKTAEKIGFVKKISYSRRVCTGVHTTLLNTNIKKSKLLNIKLKVFFTYKSLHDSKNMLIFAASLLNN